MGLKVNGETVIARMDVLKNKMAGGVGALPGGGLTEDSRVFACTDEAEPLKALVREDRQDDPLGVVVVVWLVLLLSSLSSH